MSSSSLMLILWAESAVEACPLIRVLTGLTCTTCGQARIPRLNLHRELPRIKKQAGTVGLDVVSAH